MSHKPNVLLFTGHLLDSADRQTDRFPYELLKDIQAYLKAEIDDVTRIHKPEVAVSSLAAGGDMIFAQEILDKKIPLTVFLPFEIEKFLDFSVTYMKGIPHENPVQWAQRFHEIIQQAQKIIITGKTNDPPEDAFALCNAKMLSHALELADHNPLKILALALIKSDDEIKKGGTAEFITLIQKQNIVVKRLWLHKESPNIDKLNNLKELIPSFAAFDEKAIDNQKHWRSRFHVSLAILATIAFFDAFVTAPDHFLFGYGKEVRIFSLISSVLGVFITFRLQASDKTRYRNWTENRAKVEQIRSEVWYFLFDLWSENNEQGPYTMGEFKAYIGRLNVSGNSETNEGLLEQLKEKVRRMNNKQKVLSYRGLRLDKQIFYFKNRSNRLVKRRRQCKRLTVVFLLFSIGWGTLKMIGEFYRAPQLFTDISPLGMMISFIALVSTYVEGNNMDEMEFKYSQMSKGLETLNKEGDEVTSREGFDNWVKSCEMFLRAQNNEWSLKRDKL